MGRLPRPGRPQLGRRSPGRQRSSRPLKVRLRNHSHPRSAWFRPLRLPARLQNMQPREPRKRTPEPPGQKEVDRKTSRSLSAFVAAAPRNRQDFRTFYGSAGATRSSMGAPSGAVNRGKTTRSSSARLVPVEESGRLAERRTTWTGVRLAPARDPRVSPAEPSGCSASRGDETGGARRASKDPA